MECLSCITYECLDVVHEKKISVRKIVSRGCIYTFRGTSLKLNLPFDMCRWKVEDRDVEVVHEVLVKLHLFFISRPLQRPWVLQLLPLHRLMSWGSDQGSQSGRTDDM